MKKYESKLNEGKQQAIQIFKKNGWDIDYIKPVIKVLEQFDPTSPQNKYLELFAKLVLSYNTDINNGTEQFKDDFKTNNVFSKLADIEKRNLKLDLKKIKDIDSFVKEVNDTVSTITKSKAKKGLTGLKEGTDYIKIPSVKQDSFIPLNYEASKVIASDKVGSCEGKWCTAFQKTSGHWNSYIVNGEGILVYIIANEEKNMFNQKQAIYFYNDKKNVEAFDANDKLISSSSILQFEIIRKFVYNNWDKLDQNIR